MCPRHERPNKPKHWNLKEKRFIADKRQKAKAVLPHTEATSVHTADPKSPRKAKSESDIFQYVLFKKTCKYPLKNIGKLNMVTYLRSV